MSFQLLRIHALLGRRVLDTKFAALERAVKAFDPNQPRVPVGNPDGGQWTDGGGSGGTATSSREDGSGGAASAEQRSDFVVLASYTPGGDDDEPPKVPKERPGTSRARTRVLKQLGFWVARQIIAKRGKALFTILEQAGWLEPSIDIIRTFADPPKSLEKLQRSASPTEPGYDDHHIVEKTAALRDDFPSDIVNGRENLVRIPFPSPRPMTR